MTRRGLLFRLPQTLIVAILAFVMLGASNTDYRFKKLGHELVCTCGDNQILLECNHTICPSAPTMVAELKQQLASGASDEEILKWFAAKYGPTVLAAPIRGGFDLVAWIVPSVLLVFALVGTSLLILYWKRKADSMAAATAGHPNPTGDALRDRIRRETEEL